METVLLNYLNEYGIVALVVSFIIGIISSLNPCSVLTLPFFIGSSITLSNHLEQKDRKVFIYKYSLFFFVGLVISYSILLLLFTQIGTMLRVAPSFMYFSAGVLTLFIVGYSAGLFGSVNTSELTTKLMNYKFYGALLIGLIHGFITSPCGSAPFIALLTLASQTNWITSYSLVLSFAIGQAMILLLSGIFIGFIQSVGKNKIVIAINNVINKLFLIVLLCIGFYFIYKGCIYF